MNLRRDPERLARLASEYVLGTLRGGARRRFEAAMADDAVIRQAVSAWQARLLPLGELVPAVTPPRDLFDRVEARLGLDRRREDGDDALARALRFWRGLGIGATALAAGLLIALAVNLPARLTGGAERIAVLADARGSAALIVRPLAGRSRHYAVRRAAALPDRADGVLQLWAIGPAGKPVSLGLLADDGAADVALPAGLAEAEVTALAVSREPVGGSPLPGPSGPVVLQGTWIAL